METIEKGLQNLDAITKESIDTYKKNLAKTLYDTAYKSHTTSKRFDTHSKDIFPEALNFVTESIQPFNPHTVVEFRDGKSYQVIDNWDKTTGLLPNRTVMGEYYLDSCVPIPQTSNNNYFCITHKHLETTLYDASRQILRLNCGCHTFLNNYNNNVPLNMPLNMPLNVMHSRDEGREYILHTVSQEFEVDNYLNLFHKSTGLYLMLHKTTFPNLSFYLAKEFTQLPSKTYYCIYLSKRLNTITFEFNSIYYNSLDKRNDFLQKINELVPDTYQHTYQLFNRFRLFESFDEDCTEGDISMEGDISKEKELIKLLQNKLNNYMERIEKLDSIVSEMTEEYNKKSIDCQSLLREKNLLELKLLEKEKEKDENINDIIENTKQESFQLYKRLAEAESFLAKTNELGISMKTLESKYEEQTLEMAKIKDINKQITIQIKQEKERNNKLNEDNKELLRQINNSNEKIELYEKQLKDLNLEFEKISKEYSKLNDKLYESSSKSDNALENALSYQLDELRVQVNTLTNSNNTLKTQKQKLDNDLSKIRKTLNALKI
jgi:hypothetical protein